MTQPETEAQPRQTLQKMQEEFVLTQEDFNRFARLSGDHNPIHVDPEYAASTRFGATVSHGMLLFTVLRGMIEAHYPGARLKTQDLKFPAPTFTDQPIRVTLLVEAEQPGRVELVTQITQQERLSLDGRCCVALAEELPR